MNKNIFLLLISSTISMHASEQPLSLDSSSSTQSPSHTPLWQYEQTHGINKQGNNFKTYTITDNQTKNFITQKFILTQATQNEVKLKLTFNIEGNDDHENFEKYLRLNTLLLDNKELALRKVIKKIIVNRPDLHDILKLSNGFKYTFNSNNSLWQFAQHNGTNQHGRSFKTYTLDNIQTADSITQTLTFPLNEADESQEPDLEITHRITGKNDKEKFTTLLNLHGILSSNKEIALRQEIKKIITQNPQLQTLLTLTNGFDIKSRSIHTINQYTQSDLNKNVLFQAHNNINQ